MFLNIPPGKAFPGLLDQGAGHADSAAVLPGHFPQQRLRAFDGRAVGGNDQDVGAVIQGATPHADLINAQGSRSLAGIALDKQIRVINAVVCAGNLEQAIERCGTKAGNKGCNGNLSTNEMRAWTQELAYQQNAHGKLLKPAFCRSLVDD